MLELCGKGVVDCGKGFGSRGGVGGCGGSQELEGVCAYSSIGFKDERAKFGVGVSSAFVGLAACSGICRGGWLGVVVGGGVV